MADGTLRASGPLKGTQHHNALLILSAPDHAALDAIIASDPFRVEGPTKDMTVTEWDPIFGAFNADSSMPQG